MGDSENVWSLHPVSVTLETLNDREARELSRVTMMFTSGGRTTLSCSGSVTVTVVSFRSAAAASAARRSVPCSARRVDDSFTTTFKQQPSVRTQLEHGCVCTSAVALPPSLLLTATWYVPSSATSSSSVWLPVTVTSVDVPST